ncbi:coiled-coil domain-containing protein 18 isoform X2 [Microcaecilia unicolor]|uniref:Coiled-coil domain-containing protein 18 isoform X2 n=1 Tax=Microcaecilia unicolor TaxID=1415580 RepID=A0A6P7Y252_9AMPH|nr:coiled-coil domain-containing protein 18 isoform X2 [Microcaecilia unicolor]
MEYELPEHPEEGNLIVNVLAIRNQLKKTERSLQSLEEELYSDRLNENSDSSSDGASAGLTLKDLEEPQIDFQKNKTLSSGEMSLSHGSPRRLQDKSFPVPAASYRHIEQENKTLREKLNSLREQNASLVSQNHHLMNDIEFAQADLTQSKARVYFYESALGTHVSNVPQLEEQIINLEAEVDAQGNALRDAKVRLEESQKLVSSKEHFLQTFKDEYKNLKDELLEQRKRGKRAEQQRNEALKNAEQLTKAFEQYKEKLAEKLEQVQAEEETVQKNLMNCEKERATLQEKCNKFETKFKSVEEQLSQMKEQHCSEKEKHATEVKNAELVSLLAQANEKILELENKLVDREYILKEKDDLMHQNRDLQLYVSQQNEKHQDETLHPERGRSSFKWHDPNHLVGSFSTNDVGSSSWELNNLLIADLRLKLSMKDAEIQKLQASLTSCRGAPYLSNTNEREGQAECYSLEAEPVKLNAKQSGHETFQQQGMIIKEMEKDKQTLTGQVEGLNAKLAKAEDEVCSLKVCMDQRTTQFQGIQKELLEKAAKSNDLEHELRKKRSQLSATEKQLEEKTVDCSSLATRNSELELKLMGCNNKIFCLEQSISKKQEEATLAFEKAKKIYLEQHMTLEEQIALLQHQLDKECQRLKIQETTISVLQQDILSKQHQLDSLDRALAETKQEFEKQNAKKDEAMKKLQNQVADETNKVRQLDSALGICKEELMLYLHQLEDNREMFDTQFAKKVEEIHHLQKELMLRTHNLQETNEENARLQLTLQQQQQMLQQGTVRIGELEDSQGELEKQVSKLEKDLQRKKAFSREELKRMEEKLHVACEDADLKSQQVLQLSSTLKQLTHELDLSRNELRGMEEAMKVLRHDNETKTVQFNHLEMTLQQTQAELDKKTEIVNNLESKLQNSKAYQEDFLQRREELEHDLQSVQKELKGTVRRLQELEGLLQNTQLSLEEKKATIKDLAGELRRYKSELEDRDQELADMNQALKERNWELKQRAAQVTQLDMTVREHRGELEQKIIRLESSFEKSELQVKDYKKQIESLDEKFHHTKDQLHDKDFELLQKDQELNQLKKEIERKQLKIADVEKTMKDQEQCIADQYQERLDASQQLRLAQEQIQRTHLELLDTKQQLSQAQSETEKLAQQLEENNHLLQEKRSHAEVLLLAENQKSSNVIEELKQRKQELREAQEAIGNLQRDLQTKNEMIQTGNDALLVKESEVTRLQARISWYMRTIGSKQPYSSLLPSWQRDPSLEIQDPAASVKGRKLRRSISASDITLKDYAASPSLDLPETVLGDQKHIYVVGPATIQDHEHDSSPIMTSSLDETLFSPLAYNIDGSMSSDCDDLQTLSGMLKYINKEMKIAEISLWEIQATTSGAESIPKGNQ